MLTMFKHALQFCDVCARHLQHQLLGAHAVEGHLHQRVVAQGPHAEHHALAKGPVLDSVPLLQLEETRGGGGPAGGGEGRPGPGGDGGGRPRRPWKRPWTLRS